MCSKIAAAIQSTPPQAEKDRSSETPAVGLHPLLDPQPTPEIIHTRLRNAIWELIITAAEEQAAELKLGKVKLESEKAEAETKALKGIKLLSESKSVPYTCNIPASKSDFLYKLLYE
jgi:hypothetical protein